MAEAYIVAAARTAGGRKGGRLAGWHTADLAASVLDALVERSGAAPDQVEDVIMGCVMQVGEQSNNIARNAIMASKLPESVPGTSIDRQYGSSQQALHFAAQAVMSGTMDVVIAAGVEAMTRVPMGLASSLPAKNGFGHYKSPNIEKRYPHIQFSQFTTSTSSPMAATSARSLRRRAAGSRTRSFHCPSSAQTVRATPIPSTRAFASKPVSTASEASN
jgi:acetyl-CoA C-acetyltransferase